MCLWSAKMAVFITWLFESSFCLTSFSFFTNGLACIHGDIFLSLWFWMHAIEAMRSSLAVKLVLPAGANHSASVTLFDHLPAAENVVLCRSSAWGMPVHNVIYHPQGTATVSRCMRCAPFRQLSVLFLDAIKCKKLWIMCQSLAQDETHWLDAPCVWDLAIDDYSNNDEIRALFDFNWLCDHTHCNII